jgi:deoxyribodipyrimidine photolyase-related protein
MACNNLVIVLGDQLWTKSPALDNAKSTDDLVVMIEAREEATYIPQHKIRLVLFFSAMRHFRDELKDRGYAVSYSALDDTSNCGSIGAELRRLVQQHKPKQLVCLQPGDYRVLTTIENVSSDTGIPLKVVEDTHFISSTDDFREHRQGRKSLIMEYFYRDMRRRTDTLMVDDKPAGGQWNFDGDNRETFGKSGPPDVKAPRRFRTDRTTDEVIALVEDKFADAPGRLDAFDYPVTREQARGALRDFIEHRLSNFGRYQDAMAIGYPYLFHSRLSSSLNLHLLEPRDAIEAAIKAHDEGDAALNSVEGFVRQILGWREFVRGVYWTEMPDYAELNKLDADIEVPAFMWTAETEMTCVKESVGQLVDHAYAHHIQRLMVLGLFNMLLGAKPYDVHRWHMSMYADAIDWVSLPNVLGMSQHGDGGLVGTKPYAASGNYISKMSDYCSNCRFKPGKATGNDACPFTTLYGDFLSRNRNRLKSNRRMNFQFKNLDRKDDSERRDIRKRAEKLKMQFTAETYLT